MTELIANDPPYFQFPRYEQTLTKLITMCGWLQTYRGAASFRCEFTGEVYFCMFVLELLLVISSHNSLSHSVT